MNYSDDFWLGYCVGLYEGEGTCHVSTQGRVAGDPQVRHYPRLIIRMTDQEPIELCAKWLGGTARGPLISPSEAAKGYQPKYRWSLSINEDTLPLVESLIPALSVRRQGQIRKALALILPRMRQKYSPGNKLRGELPPMRAKRAGELVCPEAPEPSTRGYQRHRKLGSEPCDICRESYNLWAAKRREWYADKIKAGNAAQYAKNREARKAYQRAYNARKRAERQTQSSS